MIAGKWTKPSGFTLIELLITMAVIVIVATIAVPSFQNMINNNRLSTDFNQVLTAVSYAKSEAAKRRTNVTVLFGVDGGGWKVEIWRGDAEDADECSLDSLCLRSISESSSPVSISTVPESGKITFSSLGRAAISCSVGTPCSVTLNHPVAGEEVLMINSLGNIYSDS